MIFEYKCRRCGTVIASEYSETKYGLAAQLDFTEEKKVIEEGNVRTSPLPNWIFHKGCPGVQEIKMGYASARFTPVPGMGIADLIGGR